MLSTLEAKSGTDSWVTELREAEKKGEGGKFCGCFGVLKPYKKLKENRDLGWDGVEKMQPWPSGLLVSSHLKHLFSSFLRRPLNSKGLFLQKVSGGSRRIVLALRAVFLKSAFESDALRGAFSPFTE